MEVLLFRLGVTFGLCAGYWWMAHQLAWWTFGLAGTGGFLLAAILRIAAEDSTSNRGKQ